MSLECQICHIIIETPHGFSNHITKYHKISMKEYYDEYMKSENEDKCRICGKLTQFLNIRQGYRKYCCSKCSRVDPEVYEKAKRTNIDKYGVTCSLQNAEVREKGIQTKTSLYGDQYYCNSDKTKEHAREKTLQKYREKVTDCEIVDYDINSKLFHCKCKECNNEFYILQNVMYLRKYRYKTKSCTICNPIEKPFSMREKELLTEVQHMYNGIILENDRTILKPYELDIYLPDLKLGIEFNGEYWHSLPEAQRNDGIKRKMAQALGIQIYTVNELDWLNDKEKVIQEIKERLNGR